jgi:seryl-tRNA(Sec) selenium transferase
VAIRHSRESAERLEARLRALDPPVVARIENDCVVLDLRTITPQLDERLAELVAFALTT